MLFKVMRKNGVFRGVSINRKEKRPMTELQGSLLIKDQGDEEAPERETVKKQSQKSVWF